MQSKQKVSLSAYNTMGVSVACDRLIRLFDRDKETLKRITDIKNENNFLILGGGSNILFTKDFEGIVCLNELQGINVINEDKTKVIVEVSGGENWHNFVLTSLEKGWYGLENLSLIPGKVGACPIQNIGAYGVEIKDFFVSLIAWDFQKSEVVELNKEDCEFAYRDSIFKGVAKGRYLILSVCFELSKEAQTNTSYGIIEKQLNEMGIKQPSPLDVSAAVIAIRQSKLPDPKDLGNCGSFFKNPIVPNELIESLTLEYPEIPVYPVSKSHSKLAAGWLIDQAGWKGFRKGDAGVHKKQALVLVNYGQATGRDLYRLSCEIIDSIQDKFGVKLEREVNIL